jgi:hypothetical protein
LHDTWVRSLLTAIPIDQRHSTHVRTARGTTTRRERCEQEHMLGSLSSDGQGLGSVASVPRDLPLHIGPLQLDVVVNRRYDAGLLRSTAKSSMSRLCPLTDLGGEFNGSEVY